MSKPRRVLCGGVDIKDWSRRAVPEQIRAQQSLINVVYGACREAGLPEQIVQSSGDGVLVIPPGDIDESAVIPDLIRGLTISIRQENRLLSDPAKIRLRLALTSGMVSTGPTGFSGPAIIDCFRLLDSPPLKKVLTDYPAADLAVIVSNYLYMDVIQHGFRDLRPEEFWHVQSALPERDYTINAWMWASDRTGGPSPAAGPEPTTSAPAHSDEIVTARDLIRSGKLREATRILDAITPEGDGDRLAVLDARADCLIATGHHQQAIGHLEEMLRIQPDAPAGVYLRLSRGHLELGNVHAARHTLKHLIGLIPVEPEAYLELGRLERLAGDRGSALTHLAEAAKLLAAEGMAGRLIEELLELSATQPVITPGRAGQA